MRKFFRIVGYVFAATIIFIEFIVWYWVWAGDGVFNLLVLPLVTILLGVFAHVLQVKKIHQPRGKAFFLLFGVLPIVPVSLIILNVLAFLFGVDNHVE